MRIIITDNQILELLELARQGRAKQANISQKTETESKKQHETTESQKKTESKKQQENTDMNKKPEPGNIQKKPGESRASHEPPLPRIRMKICEGGEGGNHHREQLCTSGQEELKGELTTEEHTMEELTAEELMTGSTIQLKEHIPLTSDIATDSEEELCAGDSGSDYDDVQDLLREINSTTLDHAKGNYFPETVGDQGSYRTDSSWGPTPDTTMWGSFGKDTVTSFVIGSENLVGLLPTRPGGGLGCGSITVGMLGKFKEEKQFFPFTSTEPSDIEEEPSDVPHLAESFLFTLPDPPDSEEEPPDVQHLVGSLPPSLQEEQQLLADSVLLSPMEEAVIGATGVLAQEEPWAPTRAPNDIINIENYNNNYHCSVVPSVNIDADVDEGEVDEDPPTRSKYDQTNKGESITIMEVIAGTDVKKKDDTVIVATEGGTHGKIIGYNSGYYYDCDYWDAYDIRDENMEIESGTRLPSASYLSPCKALLRAGGFVFTGQPPGG